MGDRANVVVKTGAKEHVVFYTHWGGYQLPADVQTALAKKWRWKDASYLARIIFDEVNWDPKTETGIGISGNIMGNEHEILVVDGDAQKVELYDFDYEDLINSWTFGEFIAIENISYAELRGKSSSKRFL